MWNKYWLLFQPAHTQCLYCFHIWKRNLMKHILQLIWTISNTTLLCLNIHNYWLIILIKTCSFTWLHLKIKPSFCVQRVVHIILILYCIFGQHIIDHSNFAPEFIQEVITWRLFFETATCFMLLEVHRGNQWITGFC